MCGCARLPLKQLAPPVVSGRGDGALKFPKYTSIAVFVHQDVAPFVRLQSTAAHSFGAKEGSKGAVAMVLSCYDTTLAFLNCHLGKR